MQRIVMPFGAMSGAVLFAVFLSGSTLAMRDGTLGQISGLLGYPIMLVGLSVIFVGIKRYRDREMGGVIRFGRAMLVGLGISLVASVANAICWEVYHFATGYTFVGEYAQAFIDSKRSAGVEGEELEAVIASMEIMKQRYASPLSRGLMAFLAVFPFGLIISLISAALLRNSRFLPASS